MLIRKICFCSSGFPTKLQGEKARRGFLEEVFRVEDFLKDPWLLRPKIGDGDGDGGGVAGTLQVLVPRVVPPPPPPPLPPVVDDEFGADLGELLSERSKRAVLQKRGVAASLAAEDYARRSAEELETQLSLYFVNGVMLLTTATVSSLRTSDEKYLEFQADGNLYYKCAACRGDCYQVQDDSDAVQELWRRRDKADKGLIASLRAAAGLPSHEETFSISPYSDDEDNSPSKLKHEYVRPLKFSVKGSAHKTSKSDKEHGKKSSSKKYGKKKAYQALTTEKTERNDSMRSYGNEAHDTTIPGSTQERCSINQAGVMKHEFIPEASAIEDRAAGVVNYWNSKSSGSDLGDGSGKHATMSETVRARKIVIHCGRNRHATNSPRSEASSCHKEQDLTTSNGSEDTGQQKANDKSPEEKQDRPSRVVDSQGGLRGSRHRLREGSLTKLGKGAESSDINSQISRANAREAYDNPSGKSRLLSGRSTKEPASEPAAETPSLKKEEASLRRHSKDTPNAQNETCDADSNATPGLDPKPSDPKPLKLKFKQSYTDNRSCWVALGEEEKTAFKGQRSKRKRPSPLSERTRMGEVDDDGEPQDTPLAEAMDANWILKKLGKDAIGKRVEVHQPSDSSW
ncbi:hypothetical protein Syun_017505 [Stephania yunnanensis]|uniref:Uncharacterized protein n=1 Tax=Stephania yunnanensis TaxID=152371 RepID=A0AAP0P345_9MAGN